jgi:hypothetical protein
MDISSLLSGMNATQRLDVQALTSGVPGVPAPDSLPSYGGSLGGTPGQPYGAGGIKYATFDTGAIHYDASADLGLQFAEKAMNGQATTGDFMAMFESFQTRMMDLLLKGLKAAGLTDEQILGLANGSSTGKAFISPESLQQEAFSGESGEIPTQAMLPETARESALETATAMSVAPEAEAQGVVTEETRAPSESGLHLPPALEPYREAIRNAAEKSGMPAEVIAGMIWAESRGNLSAQTTNGGNGLADSGLMQINSNTFADLKAKHPALLGDADVNDPDDNILAGALYLREQYDAFDGDMGAALRAYNSGPNNVNMNDLSDISKTGTGNPDYVEYVTGYARTIATGEGTLPA